MFCRVSPGHSAWNESRWQHYVPNTPKASVWSNDAAIYCTIRTSIPVQSCTGGSTPTRAYLLSDIQTPQTPVNMHNHIEIYERIHNIHIVSVYAHAIKNHNIMNIHWRIIRLRRGFWRMLRVPVLYIKNDVETIWSVPALFCIRPCNVERGRLGCAIAWIASLTWSVNCIELPRAKVWNFAKQGLLPQVGVQFFLTKQNPLRKTYKYIYMYVIWF